MEDDGLPENPRASMRDYRCKRWYKKWCKKWCKRWFFAAAILRGCAINRKCR